MVKSTIEFDEGIREGLGRKALETRGVAAHEDADLWWTVARRAFDRTIDTQRLEETLRLRQNNPGE